MKHLLLRLFPKQFEFKRTNDKIEIIGNVGRNYSVPVNEKYTKNILEQTI